LETIDSFFYYYLNYDIFIVLEMSVIKFTGRSCNVGSQFSSSAHHASLV